MNPTNWKTNILGLVTIALGVTAFILATGTPQDKAIVAVPVVTAGIGLLAAKDHDK